MMAIARSINSQSIVTLLATYYLIHLFLFSLLFTFPYSSPLHTFHLTFIITVLSTTASTMSEEPAPPPLKKTWTGYQWATAILYDLQKGDWGIPVVWISDRDKRFVTGFWKGLFTALRTKLLYTAAYHPSADDQSEPSNQTAEIWLRHWQNLHQNVDWDEGRCMLCRIAHLSLIV